MPRRLRRARARRGTHLHCAAMRAATIRDGEVVVEDHPDPEPGSGEILDPRPGRRPQRRRPAAAQGHVPRAEGLAPGHPGARAGRRGRRPRAGRRALRRVGDQVMSIVGGGGQAELATVHERQAMPVPESLDWHRGGRRARGLHHRPRRRLHAVGPARRRAPARPRRGRRRRHRGRPARAQRGRPRDRHRPQSRRARRRRASSARTRSSSPRASRSTGRSTSSSSSSARPNLGPNLKALRTERADRRHRHRGRREGRAEPAAT